MPLIIGGLVIGTLVASGYSAKHIADALEEMGEVTKWMVIGGVVYVSYKGLQATGTVK